MTVNPVDSAISRALACADAEQARKYLSEALADGARTAPREVVACLEAADEHLEYSELMEARTLLTVAHGLLARLEPVLPSPSTPGDVALRARVRDR